MGLPGLWRRHANVLVGAGALLWGGAWILHALLPRNLSGIHQFPSWVDPYAVGLGLAAAGVAGIALRDGAPGRLPLLGLALALALGGLAVPIPYAVPGEGGAVAGLLLLGMHQALLVGAMLAAGLAGPHAQARLFLPAMPGGLLLWLGTFRDQAPPLPPLQDPWLVLGHLTLAASLAWWSWPPRPHPSGPPDAHARREA